MNVAFSRKKWPRCVFEETPAGWEVDRIRDRLDSVVGGEWGEDPHFPGEGRELPVIRVADIRGIDVQTQGLTIRRVKQSKLKGRLISSRTVLLEKSGGGDQQPVGRAVRCLTISFDAICSNFMAKVDCDNSVDASFITYLLYALYDREVNVTCIQQTTGIQNLRVLDYLNTKVALPNRLEQELIARYLNRSWASLDAAINAKYRQIETLHAVKENLIESAVTMGLNPKQAMRRIGTDWVEQIPEHWQVCRIKRVVDRVDYGISISTAREGNYPVLKMANIQSGELVFSNIEFVEDVSAELLLDKGDLLYNRTNSPDQVGKAAIFRGELTDKVTFASYLVRLRMNHLVDPYFFNYLVNSRGFLSFARKLAIPSVQQSNLNSTRYCRILIPLPPKPEQEAIQVYLDSKINELRRLGETINTQIETLLTYRKSLIHECVTGKRRITDADLKQAGVDV